MSEQSLTNGTLYVERLGRVSYAGGRAVQEARVESRVAGECPDSLLILEHSPTLSLGQRVHGSLDTFELERWQQSGVDIALSDRGGEITYHGPGQIILYPVILLRNRKFGIREFVSRGLEAIAESLRVLGIPAEARLCPAGVWMEDHRKLASVGLRVVHGVTSHGFAINMNIDLEPFSRFVACGAPDARATSVCHELRLRDADLDSGVSSDLANFLTKAEEGLVESFARNLGYSRLGFHDITR